MGWGNVATSNLDGCWFEDFTVLALEKPQTGSQIEKLTSLLMSTGSPSFPRSDFNALPLTPWLAREIRPFSLFFLARASRTRRARASRILKNECTHTHTRIRLHLNWHLNNSWDHPRNKRHVQRKWPVYIPVSRNLIGIDFWNLECHQKNLFSLLHVGMSKL